MMELNIETNEFNGKMVRIIYRGTGRFEKIDMVDEKDKLLYYLEKDISFLPASEDYKILRREYFNGEEKPRRVYRGWRNSFIEFCRKIEKTEKLSITKNINFLTQGLSKKIIKVYLEQYQKLFGKI